MNLLKGKWVLDFYQPYDELKIDSNEEEDEQSMPKASND